MENVEMETFNDNIDVEEKTQEETSFLENVFDEEDYDQVDDINLKNEEVESFDTWIEKYKDNIINSEAEDKRLQEINTLEKKRERWETDQKRKISEKRKAFFRRNFNQEIVMRDGPWSKKVIIECSISESDKTGKVNGVMFKNVRVIVKGGKNFVLSIDKKTQTIVNEFNEIMKKAKIEHEKTANAAIEETVGSLPGTSSVNAIRSNVIEDVEDKIALNRKLLSIFNEDRLRNLTGVLKTKGLHNLNALDKQAKDWEDATENEKDLRVKAEMKSISDVAKLQADVLRLKYNIRPIYDITHELIENNDLTKFQKFKKFAKNNLGVLSAVSIGIAGIITTVILAGKKGLITTAKAAGALAKATAKLGKAAMPILVPLVNVLVTALSWGAKGMAWLAKNLWLLAIALSYILYNRLTKRNK